MIYGFTNSFLLDHTGTASATAVITNIGLYTLSSSVQVRPPPRRLWRCRDPSTGDLGALRVGVYPGGGAAWVRGTSHWTGTLIG